jgi:hypothetical protein
MVHLTAQQAQPWLADVERSLLCSHLNGGQARPSFIGQTYKIYQKMKLGDF